MTLATAASTPQQHSSSNDAAAATTDSASASMSKRAHLPRAVPLLDPSRCSSTEQALESICHFVAAHYDPTDIREICVVCRRFLLRTSLEELLHKSKVSYTRQAPPPKRHVFQYLIRAGTGQPLQAKLIPKIVKHQKELEECDEEQQLQQALELSRVQQTKGDSTRQLVNDAMSTEAAALEYALKISQQETTPSSNAYTTARTPVETPPSASTKNSSAQDSSSSSPATLQEEAAIGYAIQLSQQQQQQQSSQQQLSKSSSSNKPPTRVSFSKTRTTPELKKSQQEAQDEELARRVAKDGSLVFQLGDKPGKPLLEVYDDPDDTVPMDTSNRQHSASSAVSEDEALALRVAVEGSLVLHEQEVGQSLNPRENNDDDANSNKKNNLPGRQTEQQQSLQSLQDSTSSALSEDEALALRVAVEGSLVLHEQEPGKPLVEDNDDEDTGENAPKTAQLAIEETDELLALRVAREGSWVLSNSIKILPDGEGAIGLTSTEETPPPPAFRMINCLQCRHEIKVPLVFQKIACPSCKYVNRSD